MADERLNTFIVAARCGNLTQAAKQLGISQPAVTLQIHKLESDYRSTLFYRKERGVELTEAGKLLYAYSERISRLYDEAAEELEALNSEMRGYLRIGATLTLGEYVLPSVIGQYKLEYPNVGILLEVENTARIIEQVAAGTLDCGVVEGPFENGLIRAEKLDDDELMVVCSPQHRLAGQTVSSLDEILNQPFIMREPGSGTRRVFEDALVQAGADPSQLQILMQLGSTQAIKALAAQNIGLSVLSKHTVVTDIQNGVLSSIEVTGLDLRRCFSFVFKKDTRLSLMAKRFVLLCREKRDEKNTGIVITT